MEDKIKNLINLYYTDRKICKELHIAQKTLIEYKNKNNISNSRLKFKNLQLNHFLFEKIDSEEKAYWLGFLYADGCVYKEKIAINLVHSDSYHLIKFQKLLNYNITPKIRKRNKNNNGQDYCNFTISSKKLTNDLINLGCTPNKTLSLKFPTEEQVPKHLIHHFIRGYFDGDGSISKTKYYSYAFCGTEDMMNGINNVLLNNNVIKKPIKIQQTKSKTLHIIKKSGNIGVLLFKEWLYRDATIYLQRKKSKFDNVVQSNKLFSKCKLCNNKFYAKELCRNHYEKQKTKIK
jgi:hypothetical protein